jgi:hypothetical protein
MVKPLCVENSAIPILAPPLMLERSILSKPYPADAKNIAATDESQKTEVLSVARKTVLDE